jgi:hypothetical protein
MGAVDVSLEAGEDLSSKQYFAVTRDGTTGKAEVSGANAKSLGILQNKPTSGDIALVRVSGVSNALINETAGVTFGKFLTPTATGDLEICDAAGEEYIAKALGAYADNDIAEVLVTHGEVEASDA